MRIKIKFLKLEKPAPTNEVAAGLLLEVGVEKEAEQEVRLGERVVVAPTAQSAIFFFGPTLLFVCFCNNLFS
jgi:hypothetical protein